MFKGKGLTRQEADSVRFLLASYKDSIMYYGRVINEFHFVTCDAYFW